jgi:deoxycytidine triphosphate deaminase
MILSDSEIRTHVAAGRLLANYDPNRIKYCGYELTLGDIFLPETGEMQSIAAAPAPAGPGIHSSVKCWTVRPAETLLAITRETVIIPDSVCATYGQLNRLANRGLMILNTSIVEPGYNGPLSCLLVNFSSQPVSLCPGESIAKINFHQLLGVPTILQPTITRADYERQVAKNAVLLPKSLLDISGVEKRVSESVGKGVRRSFIIGGIIIAVLLFWSQMEGVFSNWIWQKTGLMSTSKQAELDSLRKQLENQEQRDQLKSKIEDLEKQIKEIKASQGDAGGAHTRVK